MSIKALASVVSRRLASVVARRLSRSMAELSIAHHYEEFDGTHSNIDHRLDVSLPFLCRALSDSDD